MANEVEAMPAPEFGRSLSGMGINLLVASVKRELDFLTGVFKSSEGYIPRRLRRIMEG